MKRRIDERLAANPPIDLLGSSEKPLLLTEKRAAAYLGVSLPFLRRGRSCGTTGNRTSTPPFVRVNGRIFYRLTDLQVWVDALSPQEVV